MARKIAILGLLSLMFLIHGCGSAQKSSVAAGEAERAYTCPSCKETVTWSYSQRTGPLAGRRIVTHECPSCKKTWGANLKVESTCAECGANHLTCPICLRHGS